MICKKEYIDKDELMSNIDRNVCGWCRHFNGGQYSSPCRVCKVSLVCREIALATCYDISQISEENK